MAAVPDFREGIQKEFLECPICLDTFENPKSLPCQHVTCSDCLAGLMNGKRTFQCPICQRRINVPDNGVREFPAAFHITKLQDYVQLQRRDDEPGRLTIPCYNKRSHEQHDEAIVKCIQCNVYYCGRCSRSHQMAPAAARHELKSLFDLTRGHFEQSYQNQFAYCQIHGSVRLKRLKHYCDNCQIPVCLECIKTEHSNHIVRDIEDLAYECRSKNKSLLQNEYLNFEKALEQRKDDLKKEINESNWELNRNKDVIHKRFLIMTEELRRQERKLMTEAETFRDERVNECEQQLIEIDKVVSSREAARAIVEHMTKVSPDYIIVNQHNEMLQHSKRTLEETTSLPELWIKKKEVTAPENCSIDMNLKVDTRSHRRIHCFDDGFTSLVIIEQFIIAWNWHGTSPTDFFVQGNDDIQAGVLRKKLEKLCPHSYRIATVKLDGSEVLLITEAIEDVQSHIKILNINQDQHEIIPLSNNMHPCALTVDRYNNIIFTDFGNPLSIRKLTRNGVQTIFQNGYGNDVLGNPWHIAVSVNDNIIISDCEKKSLIIFDAQGRVISDYRGFCVGEESNPCGICTDEQGNIYVCDYYGNNVHKIDRNGRFQDYVVTQRDGLQHPEAVAYSFTNRQLVIGQSGGNIIY